MKKILELVVQKMHEAVPEADFEVKLWDGDVIRVGEQPLFTLWFKSKNSLLRTMKDGFLGFGESYMDEDIEVEGDLIMMSRMGHLAGVGDMSLSFWEKMGFLARYLRERGSMKQAKKNLSRHYGLGTDFFKFLLDPSMTYTCAYFRSPDNSLEQAQLDKLEHVCRKLRLQPGESLVDLGCGWGGLAIHAAQHYDVTVTGVTLSKEHYEYAKERIAALGLQDRVQVLLQDYRQTTGVYDKLASIGMMEHVGKKYIPTCIRKIKELLKPGGLGLVHTCGKDTPIPDDSWTMKYIFPGFHVPVLSHIIQEMAVAGLNILDVENLRQHYALTVLKWLENFDSHREELLSQLGVRYFRCWWLWLHISLTSFSDGGNRHFQIQFTNGLNNDLPMTRDYLYRD